MREWTLEPLHFKTESGEVENDWMITDGQRCYATTDRKEDAQFIVDALNEAEKAKDNRAFLDEHAPAIIWKSGEREIWCADCHHLQPAGHIHAGKVP